MGADACTGWQTVTCLGGVVTASCWGWSATNATLNSASLQAAIFSGAHTVVVDKMPGAWVVEVADFAGSQFLGCTPGYGEKICTTPADPTTGKSTICLLDAAHPLTNCSQGRAAVYLPGNSSLGSADNTTIIFEPGVEVIAAAGSFKGVEDMLFFSHHASNLTLIGYNATLSMRKQDYAGGKRTGYYWSEFRFGLGFWGTTNLTIKGLTVRSSASICKQA